MNSKIPKKLIIVVLLSIAALGIWGSGIYYGQYLKDNYQSVSVRLEEKNQVTKKSLLSALENEKIKSTADIPVITAWNSLTDRQVKNDEIGTVTSVRLLEIYGDVRQVYPIELTGGSILVNEDYNGCLIDEKTAYELFKTTAATGCFITYENKLYCIRGVIKAPEPMVLIQISEENQSYSNLELVYSNNDNGEFMADAFLQQNLLSFHYTIINGCFFAKIMNEIIKLPAWLLGFYMMFLILRFIWKRRTLPIQAFLFLFAFVGVYIGLSRLIQFKIDVPQCLIPTKWSDFSFWTGKLHDLMKEWGQISYILPLPKDIIFVKYVKQCLFDSMTASVGMIVFITHNRMIQNAKLSEITLCLLSILTEALAVIILFHTGKEFHVPVGYLYLIPVYFLSLHFSQSKAFFLFTHPGSVQEIPLRRVYGYCVPQWLHSIYVRESFCSRLSYR